LARGSKQGYSPAVGNAGCLKLWNHRIQQGLKGNLIVHAGSGKSVLNIDNG
jgi:hypothetical protein